MGGGGWGGGRPREDGEKSRVKGFGLVWANGSISFLIQTLAKVDSARRVNFFF